MSDAQLTLPGLEAVPTGQRVLLPSPEALGMVDSTLDMDSMQAAVAKMQRINGYDQALVRAAEPDLSDPLAKASLAPPPSAFSFATMSYMPDPQAGGLLSWPGIPPEAIQRLCRTLIAPEMVIGARISDVLRFSKRSTHAWKPGWRVEMRQASKKPTAADLKEIALAESFIENCNIELDAYQARQRDAAGYAAFPTFLSKAVRDFLSYDAIAIWTDTDRVGRVKGWSCMPAGNIRLADPKVGYRQNKEWFAVLVDQGGSIKQPFRRDELIWHVGNPRTDPDIGGYPWSRVEVLMKLLDGFQNAMDMNLDAFTKSGIPMGMLLLQGMGFTQNELDAVTRQWQNLKKGVSKLWALPAMVVPKDSSIEFLNLSAAHGQDAMYVHHMNLLAGLICALWQFPHRRLGWHLSGTQRDSDPLEVKMKQPSPTEEEDTGQTTLFGTLESVINPYILWTRFPEFQFTFTAKSPREDAREYEAKQLARTWGERRAEVDLPPLEKLVKGGEDEEESKTMKKVARFLELCPADPALAGVFQSVVTTVLGSNEEGEEGDKPGQPGAPFPSSKDPAAAESHGATAGVRRHGGRADSRKRESVI